MGMMTEIGDIEIIVVIEMIEAIDIGTGEVEAEIKKEEVGEDPGAQGVGAIAERTDIDKRDTRIRRDRDLIVMIPLKDTIKESLQELLPEYLQSSRLSQIQGTRLSIRPLKRS